MRANMKHLYAYFAMGIAPLLFACASSRQMTVLEPVGPAPLRASTDDPSMVGTLKVYSLKGTYNDQGAIYYPHTDYTIFASNGTRVKQVKNALYPYDQEPVSVNL